MLLVHLAQQQGVGMKGHVDSRPSRRTSYGDSLWFQTVVDVNRTIVAHAVAENQADRDYLLRALALEAD
jgi:hypothetical protein